MSLLHIVSLFALFSAFSADQVPCPFNSATPMDCLCYNSTNSPQDFAEIRCTSASLPILATLQGVKFSVQLLSIAGNVANLPANYFADLPKIEVLQLNNTVIPQSQNWYEFAFNGSIINRLEVYDLDEVLPPSTALNQLANQGKLTTLVINQGQKPLKLMGYQFEEFKSLQTLKIIDTPIIEISDQAFVGVGSTLQTLVLTNTAHPTVEQRHFAAFVKLTNLREMRLINTGIIAYPSVSQFMVFPDLITLELSSDNLVEAINAGIFNSVPTKLSTLLLTNLGLTEIPKISFGVPVENFQLSSNQITAIKVGDFTASQPYKSISLDSNPLATIENGLSFSATNFDLGNTSISSIDLSAVENVTYLSIGNTASLKTITISDTQKPYNGQTVEVNPGLETIDSRIAYLLVRYPQFKLLIGKNPSLHCEDLAWIAPYSQCSGQVQLDDSKCSNGQVASAYFSGFGYPCLQTSTVAAV